MWQSDPHQKNKTNQKKPKQINQKKAHRHILELSLTSLRLSRSLLSLWRSHLSAQPGSFLEWHPAHDKAGKRFMKNAEDFILFFIFLKCAVANLFWHSLQKCSPWGHPCTRRYRWACWSGCRAWDSFGREAGKHCLHWIPPKKINKVFSKIVVFFFVVKRYGSVFFFQFHFNPGWCIV